MGHQNYNLQIMALIQVIAECPLGHSGEYRTRAVKCRIDLWLGICGASGVQREGVGKLRLLERIF